MNSSVQASLGGVMQMGLWGGDEVLYRSKKTIVTRSILSDSAQRVVFKQALGPQAHERHLHETSILERLAGVAGVAQLAPFAATSVNTLAFLDQGGLPLSKLLQQQTLSTAEVVGLARALSLVLVEVHRAGIIHKDINPDNILINGPELRATLIDFNLASRVAEGLPGFTHQSQIAGTLRYMAPEQTGRTGRAVDQRADLYSLGVLLYELTTGHPPFEGEDLLDLIHDHLVRVPVTPIEIQPVTPPMLSSLIMHLLEKEPDRRYQSAEGLAQDLTRLQTALLVGDETPFDLGQRDFALRLSPPSRPIGREGEIATLQTILDQAIQGQARTLLVTGIPGVGKTALINELRPMVTARRGWFVLSKFDQYQRDDSAAAVEPLRALGRLLLAEPDDQLTLHRARILSGMGSNMGLGPALLPEFVLLLGKHPGVAISDPREAEARMLQASLDLVRSIATPDRPVVVVLEDLQWAPAITLRLFNAYVTAAEDIPGLLLIGSYRSNEVNAEHPLSALLSRWTQLGLSPRRVSLDNLPATDIGNLLRAMLRLPQERAKQLAQALYERTEGNPYDTVELVNALRQDGLLTASEGHWHWHATAIRQYIGNTGVTDVLARRLAKLPDSTLDLLETMACLGGEVSAGLLALGSGLRAEELAETLIPAMDDGLLLTEQGESTMLRFRHGRVQQAVFEGMAQSRRSQQHLKLARRLAQHPGYSQIAAEQYLPVAESLREEAECRQVATLFRQAAGRLRGLNYAVAQRFLSATLVLLRAHGSPSDSVLLTDLEIELHAALYALGQLEECDVVYAAIVAGTDGPIALAGAAGIQIRSLSNRRRYPEALALGLSLLSELGLNKPMDLRVAIEDGLKRIAKWCQEEDKLIDFERTECDEPRVLACARLIMPTATAGAVCNQAIGSWLILEANRLWISHGPCRDLMVCVSGVTFQLAGMLQDYRAAYVAGRHLIAVGEARDYPLGKFVARYFHGICAAHWVEPLELVVAEFIRTRAGLVQEGDTAFVGGTYITGDLMFDCAATLDAPAADLNSAIAFAQRMRNLDLADRSMPRMQLIQAMRGATHTPGGFSDASFDEAAFVASVLESKDVLGVFHINRALSAAIFGDSQALF